MNRPRVLHFNPIENLAGAGRSMCTLMRELAKGDEVFAVVFGDDELAEECRKTGARVRTLYGKSEKPPTRLQRIVKSYGVLSEAIQDWGIDLIHSHSAQGMRYVYAPARRRRLPIVCHQRDNYSSDYFHALLGRANHVVAISEWVHRGLPKRIQRRASVVYNAVIAPDESTCDRTSAKIPVVGYAGRCIPEKGIDLFVEAVRKIDPSIEFRVAIWGVPLPSAGKKYAREIREQIDRLPHDIRRRVEVEPFRSDINNFYKSVDIVVVPSRFPEPMGRMAIESMAWERATVVANHGGLSEIVNRVEIGLGFKPGDSDDLSEKLMSLLRDSDFRRQVAAAGRKDVLTRFSSANHATELRKIYAQAMRK